MKQFTTKPKINELARLLDLQVVRATEEMRSQLESMGYSASYYNSGVYGHNWDAIVTEDYIYIHGYRNIPNNFASYPKEIKRDYLISLQ